MKSESTKPFLKATPMPIRIEQGQMELLNQFRAKTGLSKSFLIRRCIDYGIKEFIDGGVDILAFQQWHHDDHST